MSSVDEILSKLRLKFQDLNNLSSSQLRDIFLNLTVKEILRLCMVNRKFNTICGDDSFWRIKVLNDYGIEKKYGDTWKQTAIVMDKVNMINLGTKWIDGRTYIEILNDALQNGASSVLDLQKSYLVDYVDNQHNVDHILLELHDEKSIQDFAYDEFGEQFTDDDLGDIVYIKSREMMVIYATILTYKGQSSYLPGDTIEGDLTTGTSLQSYEFLREMIDPIIYVMQFSSFSVDRLNLVEY
uniref:F-box-like family protein n=1 Tax=Pithovirus LCPAC403 TaxID=2506596 RepID=A0A481ZB58_9VIRU|nr:MAG: F-box-like family protein [Pithovirus LCPAC403]